MRKHNTMPALFGRVQALFIICVLFLLPVTALLAMSGDEEFNETAAEMATEIASEKSWKPALAETRQDVQISKTVIEEIKSKEPFINIQQKKIWDFSNDDEEDFDDELDPDLAWLAALMSFFAMVVEAALWLVPLLIVLYLYRYREYCMNLFRGKGFKQDKTAIPETLFGLDMREKSLPDNIENEALQLWQQKKYRQAISLLYRGSLVALFKQYKFDLAPGATEQDCIRQIELTEQDKSRQKNTEPSSNVETSETNSQQRLDHFKQLTTIWIEIAYAHRLPSEETFIAVCNGWNQLFANIGKFK